MNKREKEQLDKYKIMLSLKFGDDIKPDIFFIQDSIIGFLYNKYTLEALKVKSEKRRTTIIDDNSIICHYAVNLYSTDKLALKAMRYEICMDYAKSLRKIDKIIES